MDTTPLHQPADVAGEQGRQFVDLAELELEATDAPRQAPGNQIPKGRPSLDGQRVPSTINDEDRLALRNKMKDLFAKIITDVDNHVLIVGESQVELDLQLDKLIATLDSIKVDKSLTDEISANAKRISSLKSRLTLIHSILSNASQRCSRTLAACSSAVGSQSASTSSTN